MLDPHLLLCYDGSDQATEAIDVAAALFPHDTRATVLYAWEPIVVAVAGGTMPVAIPPDSDEQDEARARAPRRRRSPARRPRPRLDAEARTEPATGSA
jgi:hypothetical protein